MASSGYLNTLRKHWILIVTLTVLGGIGAALALASSTLRYTANASLYFSLSDGESAGDLNQGSTYTQSQMLSFAQLATKPVVLDPVISRLDLPFSTGQLAGAVSASSPADTVLLDLSVSDEDPERAAATVDAVARQLGDVVESYSPRGVENSPTISARVVAPAIVPSSPASPNVRLALIAGVVVGLVLGVAAAFLREKLDTRLRSESDVRLVTSVPLLGAIQLESERTGFGPLFHREPRGVLAEAYRRIRANLQFVAVDDQRLSIVITSSTQGDGKTTVTTNLALALAETEFRTILIDADLRRPSVAKLTGMEGSVGLTTVLSGQATIEDVAQPWADTALDIVASGPIPPNPSELLSSGAMVDLLTRLEELYDIILIDTPPVLAVADATILAPLTSGAVVVVDRRKSRAPQLLQSLDVLEKAGVPLLGLVLNRVSRRSGARQYSYESDDSADALDQSDAVAVSSAPLLGRVPGSEPDQSVADDSWTDDDQSDGRLLDEDRTDPEGEPGADNGSGVAADSDEVDQDIVETDLDVVDSTVAKKRKPRAAPVRRD